MNILKKNSENGGRLNVKRKEKGGRRWRVILVVLFGVILSGCVTVKIDRGPEVPTKPSKPELEVEEREGGGICLDEDNTEKFMEYIYRLEDRYNDR